MGPYAFIASYGGRGGAIGASRSQNTQFSPNPGAGGVMEIVLDVI